MKNFVDRLRGRARRSDRAPLRTARTPRHSVSDPRSLDPEFHLVPPFTLLGGLR